MSVYWFVATTTSLPDELTEGIFWSEQVGDEAEVPEHSLAYAVLCRASAESELAARALIARWFADDDTSTAPALAPIDVSRGVTRKEQGIAAGMQPGEVLVRSVFVAYPSGEPKGREEAHGLFESVVLKRWWEFWR
ncbi:MAG: hypothetical protein QM765_00780 [Myxococcales bacterium]